MNTGAHVAQQVEHVLGKNGVIGSSPIVGSSMETDGEGRTGVRQERIPKYRFAEVS